MPSHNNPPSLTRIKHQYQWLALLALAAALQLFESLLPSLGPWFKPGLANIITLITLIFLGPRAAFSLALARVIIGGLFLGTLLTPTIIISASGALVAASVMVLLWRLPSGLSLIGISLVAAIAHMVTQLVVVEALIIQQPALFYLLPPLMLLATITGWINGAIASTVVGRIGLRPW